MTDKPMNMVERVARALIADEYEGGHLSGAEIEACIEEDWETSRRKVFLRKARIVLSAMREPSEGIIDAAENAPMPMVKLDSLRAIHALHFKAKWQAAIDAALSEPEGVKE